jgi:aminoglycoside 2''-phosphotransferase
MSTHLLYLSQIRTVLPSAPFEKIEQSGGEFNDVVVINEEWVFRFPRYREGVAQITSRSQPAYGVKRAAAAAHPRPGVQAL